MKYVTIIELTYTGDTDKTNDHWWELFEHIPFDVCEDHNIGGSGGWSSDRGRSRGYVINGDVEAGTAADAAGLLWGLFRAVRLLQRCLRDEQVPWHGPHCRLYRSCAHTSPAATLVDHGLAKNIGWDSSRRRFGTHRARVLLADGASGTATKLSIPT